MKTVCLLCALGAALFSARADEDPDAWAEEFDRWYAGAAAALTLPQGCSQMRRVGGVALRGGYYLTESCAVEGEAAWQEDTAGLGVGAVWHLQGCELYDRFFGYSRFDPFFTIGARGWLGHGCGQVGPKAGVGAFFHLTDAWALRADADATLGVDTDAEMLYTVSAGVQYSF